MKGSNVYDPLNSLNEFVNGNNDRGKYPTLLSHLESETTINLCPSDYVTEHDSLHNSNNISETRKSAVKGPNVYGPLNSLNEFVNGNNDRGKYPTLLSHLESETTINLWPDCPQPRLEREKCKKLYLGEHSDNLISEKSKRNLHTESSNKNPLSHEPFSEPFTHYSNSESGISPPLAGNLPRNNQGTCLSSGIDPTPSSQAYPLSQHLPFSISNLLASSSSPVKGSLLSHVSKESHMTSSAIELRSNLLAYSTSSVKGNSRSKQGSKTSNAPELASEMIGNLHSHVSKDSRKIPSATELRSNSLACSISSIHGKIRCKDKNSSAPELTSETPRSLQSCVLETHSTNIPTSGYNMIMWELAFGKPCCSACIHHVTTMQEPVAERPRKRRKIYSKGTISSSDETKHAAKPRCPGNLSFGKPWHQISTTSSKLGSFLLAEQSFQDTNHSGSSSATLQYCKSPLSSSSEPKSAQRSNSGPLQQLEQPCVRKVSIDAVSGETLKPFQAIPICRSSHWAESRIQQSGNHSSRGPAIPAPSVNPCFQSLSNQSLLPCPTVSPNLSAVNPCHPSAFNPSSPVMQPVPAPSKSKEKSYPYLPVVITGQRPMEIDVNDGGTPHYSRVQLPLMGYNESSIFPDGKSTPRYVPGYFMLI